MNNPNHNCNYVIEGAGQSREQRLSGDSGKRENQGFAGRDGEAASI